MTYSPDLFNECTNPVACFASDREAFESLSYRGDMGIEEDLRLRAEAGFAGGQMGIALEDILYTGVEIDEVESNILYDGDTDKLIEYSVGRVTQRDKPQKIEKPADDASELDQLRYRILRCAYTCGTAALCPLRKPADS